MRFLDKLLNRSAQSVDRAPERRIANPTLDFVRQVYEAPALFNRHTRRAVGILSKVWRWDLRGTEMERLFVPRYVRRHGPRVIATRGTHRTRRERREAARVNRALWFQGGMK